MLEIVGFFSVKVHVYTWLCSFFLFRLHQRERRKNMDCEEEFEDFSDWNRQLSNKIVHWISNICLKFYIVCYSSVVCFYCQLSKSIRNSKWISLIKFNSSTFNCSLFLFYFFRTNKSVKIIENCKILIHFRIKRWLSWQNNKLLHVVCKFVISLPYYNLIENFTKYLFN